MGKHSRRNQSDATPRLLSKTEGLAKNDWHEFYWPWISMVDYLSQKRTFGGLGIESERMDFGIGIGLEVVRVSETMGERETKDKYLKKKCGGSLFDLHSRLVEEDREREGEEDSSRELQSWQKLPQSGEDSS